VTRVSAPWKEYQEAAAAFYRSLGLDAQTDERLEGARGHHDVDVAVRGYRAGVQFLWIVECKHWNRPVPKETVATLSAIIQDVGADRGIILSKSGFRSGAPPLATKSNITLSSLDELREETEGEYIQYQCTLAATRCQAVMDAVFALGTPVENRPPGRYGTKYPRGFRSTHLVGQAAVLKAAVEFAMKGKWPIDVVTVTDGVETKARVDDFPKLLQRATHAVEEVEKELAAALGNLETPSE
jgi:hypothetical protein